MSVNKQKVLAELDFLIEDSRNTEYENDRMVHQDFLPAWGTRCCHAIHLLHGEGAWYDAICGATETYPVTIYDMQEVIDILRGARDAYTKGLTTWAIANPDEAVEEAETSRPPVNASDLTLLVSMERVAVKPLSMTLNRDEFSPTRWAELQRLATSTGTLPGPITPKLTKRVERLNATLRDKLRLSDSPIVPDGRGGYCAKFKEVSFVDPSMPPSR
jgi:hypothetical protein